MHLTVGYLATPTGDDGVALASALAKTFDAEVDVVLVVREEMPDGHPGRAEYQQLLVNRGEEWVSRAVGALADRGVNAELDGARRRVLRRIADQFRRAEGLGPDRDRRCPRRHLRRPRHRLGHRCAAALLADPGRARAARLSRRPAGHHHRGHRGRPHPSRRRQPAAVRAHAGQRGSVADPDGVVGVGREPVGSRERQGSPPDSGRRRRGEPRSRRARTARCSRDRLTRRRRFDAGVGAQEAQLGRHGCCWWSAPAGSLRRAGSSSARPRHASWRAPTRP